MNFVGPSYQLATRKADVQRTVNMVLRQSETRTSKANLFLESIPGLRLFSNVANVRGAQFVKNRAFVVANATLYEVLATGATITRGTLNTSSGVVDMSYGISQLVMVDGPFGYVMDLSSNVFQRITAAGFYGSTRVGFLDNYFIFIRPDTQQFYISALDNAASLDPLDFASAEGSPDPLISLIVDHREVWLFGGVTTEVWFNTGNADFPFERSQGAFLEHGCISPHCAQKLDNSVFWIGQDSNGAGIVWLAVGYQPQRISTYAVEEALKKADLTKATAYCYQQNGSSFYCINAPGLQTTWVYDASTGAWHERAEQINGVFAPHRATCALHAFGQNLLGADKLYALDGTMHTNNGDPLVRERISPHSATPSYADVLYSRFELDCIVGEAAQGQDPQVELSWSNDGGATFGSPVIRSMGRVGKRQTRVQWNRLGRSNDRVWKVRCSADAPFAIVGAHVDGQESTD